MTGLVQYLLVLAILLAVFGIGFGGGWYLRGWQYRRALRRATWFRYYINGLIHRDVQ